LHSLLFCWLDFRLWYYLFSEEEPGFLNSGQMEINEIGSQLKEKLGLNFYPVGLYYSDTKPENAGGFKSKGNGCIMSLIFSAAKGNTIAFSPETTGWACSAFYLGYTNWIFEGIECFLSDGNVNGRSGERFVKSSGNAKEYVKSFIPEKLNDNYTILKPLSDFLPGEKPEIVIFFANADEISGLIFLLYFNAPEEDNRVVTRFMSACGAVVTVPMKYKREGKLKAVWGMHDISARLRLPKDLMTLSMPFEMAEEMAGHLDTSFVITDNWKKIKERRSHS
jgi:hypothetical protein